MSKELSFSMETLVGHYHLEQFASQLEMGTHRTIIFKVSVEGLALVHKNYKCIKRFVQPYAL